MKLRDLLQGVEFELLAGEVDAEVLQLTSDSRTITNNGLYVALKGTKVDGHEFIKQAIINGCKTIVVEKEIDIELEEFVTIVKVEDSRKAMSNIAKNFYFSNGLPSKIKMVAVTGTNGKTTTTFMLKSIFGSAGYDVGVIGTSGVYFNNEILRGEELTTPDPIEFYEILHKFDCLGVDIVFMEVSAHALYFEKTLGVVFDYSIFTNLTEDHLDFFETMENYGKAKEKLFDKKNTKVSIINVDDMFGSKIIKSATSRVISIGSVGDLCIKKISPDENSFTAIVLGKKLKIKLNMGGKYNIYNALGAIAVATLEGLKIKHIKCGLKNLPTIAGRYNVFNMGENGRVVLDFAHTPDGLEKVLNKARLDIKNGGKLISLFGCGGNRDKDKRAIMGQVAGKIADNVIISIDNPRFEDPYIVMNDIAKGVESVGGKYEIVMPRSKAIKKAVEMCSKNDIVVVSGKGVEPYYEENGIKHFYREDREIVKIQKELGVIKIDNI